MGLLRRAWREYHRKVLPRNAMPVQVLETRRGFYAGCWEIICIINAIDEPQTRNELLKELEKEAKAFKDSVGTPLEGRT